MRESKLQVDTKKLGKSLGWHCRKLETGNGDPDHLFFKGKQRLGDGIQPTAFLIEYKRLDKKPEAHQTNRHEEWLGAGFPVFAVDNYPYAEAVFASMT